MGRPLHPLTAAVMKELDDRRVPFDRITLKKRDPTKKHNGYNEIRIYGKQVHAACVDDEEFLFKVLKKADRSMTGCYAKKFIVNASGKRKNQVVYDGVIAHYNVIPKKPSDDFSWRSRD